MTFMCLCVGAERYISSRHFIQNKNVRDANLKPV